MLEARWNLVTRTGFRFTFAYLVLYSFPFPLTAIPGVAFWFRWYDSFWEKLFAWVAAHVLHLGQPVRFVFTGSGDTTFAYVQNLLILVFALCATLVWSVVDRRRTNCSYLHEWLRLYVRLVLARR